MSGGNDVIRLTAKTKVLGIIGHPVKHSLSPIMQNAAFATCGLDYVYVSFDVPPDSLERAVDGLRSLGVAGFNVTVPHKVEIVRFLDALDETAEIAGSVNTVHNCEGRLTGYNTDGDGFVRSLREDLEFSPGSDLIVLGGAGGAARGALAAICRAGAKHVAVVNRTLEKAQDLASYMGDRYTGTEIIPVALSGEISSYLAQASLFVNTTSIGMKNEKIPFVHVEEMAAHTKVYDMVYSPKITPLLRESNARGLACANGIGMLVAQGELAFSIWTGSVSPYGIMKGAIATS